METEKISGGKDILKSEGGSSIPSAYGEPLACFSIDATQGCLKCLYEYRE